MNDLREQLNRIDPKIRAEDIVAAEPAAKRPKGKLIVVGVLLAAALAVAFGWLAKKSPPAPDPRDLGAPGAPAGQSARAAAPAAPPKPAAAPGIELGAPASASPASQRTEDRPSAPAAAGSAPPSAALAAGAPAQAPLAARGEPLKPPAAPSAQVIEPKAPASPPRTTPMPGRKPQPAGANRATRAPKARQPAVRTSIDEIGITEE